MWKIRAVLSATSNEGGSQTSETFHSQSSTGNPSVAQPPEKSTDESLETFTAEDLIPDGDDNIVKTAKGTKVSTGLVSPHACY